MAYQNLRTALVTKNGVPYNLQYDSVTGNVQIIQQNAPAGTNPIYQDGRWNTSAASLGFTTSEQNQLHVQTIIAVQAAYRNIGGVNSGSKLPQWATENFSTGDPGQSSINPQSSVSGTVGGNGGIGTRGSTLTGAGAGTGGSGTGGAGGTGGTSSGNTGASGGGGIGALFGFLQNSSELYENFAVNGSNFGVGNEDKLFGKDMKYPEDLMTQQQDHFVISQYRYKPSKANAIFGGTTAAVQTLSGGLQTTSNLASIVGTVFLPMPNSVADSNNVSWGEDSMSNIAAAVTAQTLGNMKGSATAATIGGILGSITGAGFGKGAGAAMLIKNIEQLVKDGAGGPELAMLLGSELSSMLLKAQGLGVEAESILARGAGIVPNSNLELLFNAPTLRSFTFNYRMSPRSAKEAEMVRRIIRFFKQGMAVKKMRGKTGSSAAGQSSYFLGTPNVFKLQYRNGKSNEIAGVNKFKSCALTSFSCNYTPDGLWAAYEKGQPVSTTMQMTFNELEPIYDTDYQQGNIFGVNSETGKADVINRGDLSSVSSNSVGY